MNIKCKTQRIHDKLIEIFPNTQCTLDFQGDPWKLLVMARLSAQCTDARVNIVSKTLFEKFPDVYSMATADVCDIEKIIFPCGLYRTKAKSLKEMSMSLISNFNGVVPRDYDSLMSLSGVGSKIANLVRGDYFGLGGIVADTHCIRVSNRLGLVKSANQSIVERTLDRFVPKDEQSDFCHRMVDFGRSVCTAKNPKCNECVLMKEKLCKGV